MESISRSTFAMSIKLRSFGWPVQLTGLKHLSVPREEHQETSALFEKCSDQNHSIYRDGLVHLRKDCLEQNGSWQLL